jgi:hypothetical protein
VSSCCSSWRQNVITKKKKKNPSKNLTLVSKEAKSKVHVRNLGFKESLSKSKIAVAKITLVVGLWGVV